MLATYQQQMMKIKMKHQPRKLPDSIDLEKAEEIFSDRLAELIVMTLDYQYEQKLKAKAVEENKSGGGKS
jgi:uncharacterized membrane protein